MPSTERADSYREELTRIEARAETVSGKIADLKKEQIEAEEELQLLARRAVLFKTKLQETQKLIDGEPITPTAATGAQQEQATVQIAELQETVRSLVAALAQQAPQIVQSMPQNVLAAMAAQAQQQQQAQQQPQQQPQQQQQMPALGTTQAPPAVNPGIVAAADPYGVETGAIARVPTPTRNQGPRAQPGVAAGHRTAGSHVLGVSRGAIKKASKGSAATQPRGVATVAMDDDASEAEADDAAVQEQLLAFQAAHAIAAQQAQLAQQAMPVTATHSDSGLAPPAPAEVEAAAAASAAAMTSAHP